MRMADDKLKESTGILLNYMNAAKITSDMLYDCTGVSPEDVELFIKGKHGLTETQVSDICGTLGVLPKDLRLPDSDTKDCIKILTKRQSDATKKYVKRKPDSREEITYYSYRNLVSSIKTPSVKGFLLELFCDLDENVVQNNGHFQDAITYVTKGPICGYWIGSDGKHFSKVLKEGHSYFARGFSPHTYRSVDPNRRGEIISFTFCTNLAGETQNDLISLGTRRATQNIAINSAFANLLYWHRNNSMYDLSALSLHSNIKIDHLEDLANGISLPTIDEVAKLAKTLCLSTCDLMPIQSDAKLGLKHFTPEQSLLTKRFWPSPGKTPTYEVIDMVSASEAPATKSHSIKLLDASKENTEYNLISCEHTYLFVYKGCAKLRWHDGNEHQKQLENYDSVYLEPFVRYSLSGSYGSEILRFQVPSNVSGDARKELFLKGEEGIKRIASERVPWSNSQRGSH